MKSLLQTLLKARIFRVAGAGGVGVIVQTGIFELLAVYLHLLPASIAVIIAAECGVLTSFFINEHFSFHDQVGSSRFIHRIVRFHTVVLGSIFLQWLFVFLAETYHNTYLIIHIAYALGIIVGFAWNYTWYRLWVWKHHQESLDMP